MMKRTCTVGLSILLFFLSTTVALAGGMTFSCDLTGTWAAVDGWGARAGVPHHDMGEGDHWTTKAVFTLKITEQSPDGRAFHGEWCSPNACEDLVGAVMSDGTIHMADEDGFFEGRLLGDVLELCYLEAGKAFRVVNCLVMKRK